MALSTLSQCRVAGVKLRKDALLSLVEALRSGRFSEPDQVGGLSDQTLRNQLLLRGFALAAHPGTDRDVLEAKLEELILKESGLDVKLALSIGTAEWGEESASASATESFDSAASGEDDEGSGEEQLRGAFSTAQEELPPELAAAAAHMWRPGLCNVMPALGRRCPRSSRLRRDLEMACLTYGSGLSNHAE